MNRVLPKQRFASSLGSMVFSACKIEGIRHSTFNYSVHVHIVNLAIKLEVKISIRT